MRSLILVSAAFVAVTLAACGGGVKAPTDTGVCYGMEPGKDGEPPQFHVLARDQGQIELCAAQLEAMRLRFLNTGRREVAGAYQGQFIYIDAGGVWTAQRYGGARYILLARTGDGRLAAPGAIVRDADGRPTAVIE